MQVHAEGSSVLSGRVGPVLMVVNELFGRHIPNGAVRRRLHLAIPPGAPVPRSATLAEDASAVVCEETGKGGGQDRWRLS